MVTIWTSAGAVPPEQLLTPTPMINPGYDPLAPKNLSLEQGKGLDIVDPEGYPRIVKLWGGYDPQVDLGYYAQYDVIISNAFSKEQLLYLQHMNPHLVVLYSGIGTYDTDDGPVGYKWIDAPPHDWGFDCFLRGTDQQVLRVAEWQHGMFNMSNDTCTDAVVDYILSQFDPDIHDGVFFDRINQEITPYILNGIDLDHDWIADSWSSVNESYWHGTQRFLDKLKTQLEPLLDQAPIVIGNDAPLPYIDQLNGREYELQIRNILDQDEDWTWFHYNYEQWMQASLRPQMTMVMSHAPTWMRAKYGLNATQTLQGTALEQTSRLFQRMRFGLTTALLEGGLYSYEFGDTWHGNAWWYEEYDGAGLGKGYLGQPIDQAYRVGSPLTTANTIRDPGFELAESPHWTTMIKDWAAAWWERAPVTGTVGAPTAARFIIQSSYQPDDVRLLQTGVVLIKHQAYTLSFWGKASQTHWLINSKLHAYNTPQILYGLDSQIELGTTWQHYEIPFNSPTTIENATLSLDIGSETGEVWLDEIKLQEGTLSDIWRRDFDQGIVLCNTTQEPQIVQLGSIYHKLDGIQAPRNQILIDDDQTSGEYFFKDGGWGIEDAGPGHWGTTLNYAITTQDPNGFSSTATWRPEIETSGLYTVSAWLAPHPKCTDTITYTIQHTQGVDQITVSQVVSEPTWIQLGVFDLSHGTQNQVTLSNLSHAQWVIADAVKFESLSRYNNGQAVTQVTLPAQDGIILLGKTMPQRAFLSKTTMPLIPAESEIVRFELTVSASKFLTQSLPIRLLDPNPAPIYLDILTPTITGEAVYSPALDSIVWEGILVSSTEPISITFEARITDNIPFSGYAVTNQAQIVAIKEPGAPLLDSASVTLYLNTQAILTPQAFLPFVSNKKSP